MFLRVPYFNIGFWLSLDRVKEDDDPTAPVSEYASWKFGPFRFWRGVCLGAVVLGFALTRVFCFQTGTTQA